MRAGRQHLHTVALLHDGPVLFGHGKLPAILAGNFFRIQIGYQFLLGFHDRNVES